METLRRRRRDRELPAHDTIARRAYELYELRGCQDGNDWDDWFQAEDELRLQARRSALATPTIPKTLNPRYTAAFARRSA